MLPVLLAAAALPAGFATADLSGSRPLGGVVLVALAALAIRSARPLRAGRAAAWCAITALAFGVSHRLADLLGTWGAVAAAAAVVTGAAWALLTGQIE